MVVEGSRRARTVPEAAMVVSVVVMVVRWQAQKHESGALKWVVGG